MESKSLRSEWKCGNCGKLYNVDELISLKRIKAVESDIYPEKQHGYTSVCDCGYRFHIDRWKIRDNIKLNDDINLLISTVFLELNHKLQMLDGKDEYYETGIFELVNKEELKNLIFMQRYETKEEAIEGHNKILNLIKDGKYKIDKIGEEIAITFENNKNKITENR